MFIRGGGISKIRGNEFLSFLLQSEKELKNKETPKV